MQHPERALIIRAVDRSIDLGQLLEIAQALPAWFTTNAVRSMRSDFRFQNGLVAVLDQAIIGFVSFFVNQGKAEIGWMAIHPDHHRTGIGRALLMRLARELQMAEVRELYVHTLGDAVDYDPYRKTRAFYKGVGFEEFKRILKPESPECAEELILVLKLDTLPL